MSNWTTTEEILLKQIFSTATKEELAHHIPRHTLKAIERKGQVLGLRRRRNGCKPLLPVVSALVLERKRQRMSVGHMACLVHVTADTVLKWERGRLPGMLHLVCWCEVLGMEMFIRPAVKMEARAA